MSTAARYVAYFNQLVPVSGLPGRRQLLVLTVIAAFIVCNTSPVHLQSSPSISTFQQHFCFNGHFLTLLINIITLHCHGLCNGDCCFTYIKKLLIDY